MSLIYLDNNATTPLDPEVRQVLLHFLIEEFGNEGSRTHMYGTRAKQGVQKSRKQIAKVVDARQDEVIFTSGATESNNLAILGLKEFGLAAGRTHVITTAIEHKAVLEPCAVLRDQGFEVSVLPVRADGTVNPELIARELREETLLVSVMQVNNETGIQLPLGEIADVLDGHGAYFHVDAAQGFGKDLESLRNQRFDLISISGHKIYGPKGIGALIARRRKYERPPLTPLIYGGGQERGLRPGTLPVALIAALGAAAETAERDHNKRVTTCLKIREQMLSAFKTLNPLFNGEQTRTMPHVVNLRFPGLDSEALMLSLKDLIAISNGSACTSSNYAPSHVLKAMGLTDDEANQSIRISWSHLTPVVDWDVIADRIRRLLKL